MTQIEKEKQIADVMNGDGYLPIKAAKIREIHAEFERDQMLKNVEIQETGEIDL